MITSFVGPMYAGKSDYLISVYKGIWNKEHVMAFKPKKDTRDGEFIISKNYEEKIPAKLIENISEIPKLIEGKEIRTIFIDEAQFLEGDVSIITDLSVLYDIDFYIAGLNMTSEQRPFDKMPEILAISNEIKNITGSCQDCSRPSVYTWYLLGEKTESVKPGNDYVSVCPTCLRKRMETKDRVKKLTLTHKGE